MIFSAGFVMFVLFGIVIALGKLIDGDKSMGCLISILVLVLLGGSMIWILNMIAMF